MPVSNPAFQLLKTSMMGKPGPTKPNVANQGTGPVMRQSLDMMYQELDRLRLRCSQGDEQACQHIPGMEAKIQDATMRSEQNNRSEGGSSMRRQGGGDGISFGQRSRARHRAALAQPRTGWGGGAMTTSLFDED